MVETVQVECYSGHTYAQEPRVVIWKGFRAEVAHVESTWRTPIGPAFHICLDDGAAFQLQFDESNDHWLISDRPKSLSRE